MNPLGTQLARAADEAAAAAPRMRIAVSPPHTLRSEAVAYLLLRGEGCLKQQSRIGQCNAACVKGFVFDVGAFPPRQNKAAIAGRPSVLQLPLLRRQHSPRNWLTRELVRQCHTNTKGSMPSHAHAANDAFCKPSPKFVSNATCMWPAEKHQGHKQLLLLPKPRLPVEPDMLKYCQIEAAKAAFLVKRNYEEAMREYER